MADATVNGGLRIVSIPPCVGRGVDVGCQGVQATRMYGTMMRCIYAQFPHQSLYFDMESRLEHTQPD